jgi:hypothetical protein
MNGNHRRRHLTRPELIRRTVIISILLIVAVVLGYFLPIICDKFCAGVKA